MHKVLKFILLVFSLTTLLVGVAGCGNPQNNGEGSEELNNKIVFNTLSVNDNNVYGKVSNSTTTFSFLDEIEVYGNATYQVYKEITCETLIISKTISLEVGDNNVYILYNDESDTKLYSITIRRRPIYEVVFNSADGMEIEKQYVEEDGFADAFDITKVCNDIKAGYTLSLNYDFTKPVMQNTTVNACWLADNNTPYVVEYYHQNLDNDQYIKVNTLAETGTTDTVVEAEILDYEHFTFNSSLGKVSDSLNGDGTTILRVYYTRNSYEISCNDIEKATIIGAGKYKYGTQITVSVVLNLGYEFSGWYSQNVLLSTEEEYSFIVDKNVTAILKTKSEMAIFDFYSTTTICDIVGTKDSFNGEELVIPDCVTGIGGNAFWWHGRLTSVIIPNSVTYIGSDAFNFCNNLRNIIIPDSVTSIGAYAFYHCESLTSVTIGSNVETIGERAFEDCYRLAEVINKSTNITIERGSFSNGRIGEHALKVYNSDSGVTKSQIIQDNGYVIFTSGDEKILLDYVGKETNLFIPNYITKINAYAFYYDRNIKRVTISDSVKEIGEYAFFEANELLVVTIPDSVLVVGERAFYKYGGALRILCEATIKPTGWDDYWISGDAIVTWGEN